MFKDFRVVIFLTAGLAVVGLATAALVWKLKPGAPEMRPIQELRARITSTTAVPEPTFIQSTGDWYYLDHISSGLAFYDSQKRTFLPQLAESWSTSADNSHVFKLRKNIFFHDHTPITAKDIVWSIKRHLIKKTSTHFPLWDYLVGCNKLRTLSDDCEGIKETGENEITFKLNEQTDSFFLQMASPETGVWWTGDMNPETAELKPTKYSGAYFVAEIAADYALLKRNEYSPTSKSFPDSPRAIRLKRIPLPSLSSALLEGDIDFAIKQHSPMGERDWKAAGLQVAATSSSSIIYLSGLAGSAHRAIGQDLMRELWSKNLDPVLLPADSFLPFAAQFSLSREEFLAELPPATSKKLRILCPAGFFPEVFLNQLQGAAAKVGVGISFTPANQAEFFAAFSDPSVGRNYDFILSIYAASERYPAVQLRYLTNALARPPIDLKKAESPDSKEDRAAILKDYSKWLLRAQFAIPLYFDNTLFIFQPKIDIGDQSDSDAEIELWRFREKNP